MYSLMYLAVLCITIFVCVFMVAGIVFVVDVCGCCGGWLLMLVGWLVEKWQCQKRVDGKMAMSKKNV